RAHVGHAVKRAFANRVQKFSIVELLEKAERVAAADEDPVRAVELLDRHDVESHLAESRAHFLGVALMIMRGKRTERDRLPAGKETADLRLRLFEKPIAVNEGAGVGKKTNRKTLSRSVRN